MAPAAQAFHIAKQLMSNAGRWTLMIALMGSV